VNSIVALSSSSPLEVIRDNYWELGFNMMLAGVSMYGGQPNQMFDGICPLFSCSILWYRADWSLIGKKFTSRYYKMRQFLNNKFNYNYCLMFA